MFIPLFRQALEAKLQLNVTTSEAESLSSGAPKEGASIRLHQVVSQNLSTGQQKEGGAIHIVYPREGKKRTGGFGSKNVRRAVRAQASLGATGEGSEPGIHTRNAVELGQPIAA